MFETISHPATARRIDPRILPAAISLHAAVAVAALIANTWQIPEVAAPDLTEAYVMVTLPPPPDPAPAPREPERQAPEQQQTAQAPVPPPIQQPDPEQMTPLSPNPDDAGETDLSDLTPVTDPGTGPPNGPVSNEGGNGDCVENCGPGDGEGDIAYPTPGMTAPRVIERVMPVFPELAKRVRKTGRVIVKAVIDASGTVRDAEVLSRPLGFGLEESALKAIYQWRFAPAKLGDRPMAVYFNLTVDFSLQ